MITRVWHGWTTEENAQIYEELLLNEILPGIAAKQVAGYRGVRVLRRPLAGDEVEFVTLLDFDALQSIKDFVGEDYEQAYVPESARRVLKRFDERAAHFEAVEVLATTGREV